MHILLATLNIFVYPLILRLKEELTEDMVAYCKMVIIAGINAPLGDHEVQILKHYVENQGGSVFVLAEASATTHYYNALTQNFGITVVKGTFTSFIMPALTFSNYQLLNYCATYV